LAAMFRPSWETDEVPTPAAVLGAAPVAPRAPHVDLRAPHPDVPPADGRTAAPALNGSHVPAQAAALEQQPASSVIIDSGDILPSSGGGSPQARAPAAHTLVLPNPVGNAALRPASPAAIPARTVPFAPPARIATPLEMAEFIEPDFAKPARKMGLGIWAGIVVAAAAVIGIGVWLGSGSEEKRPVPAAFPERPHVAPAIPPPPAETVANQAPATAAPSPSPASPPSPPPVAAPPPPPPAAAPPPAAVAAAAPPTSQPASPAATQPPRLFVPPAPQRPTWVPPVAKAAAPPPPPARPKPATPTIVRDVPF
jgi:hypothetical protein